MKLVFAQTAWLFTFLSRNHHQRNGLGGVITTPLETQTEHDGYCTFRHDATTAMRASLKETIENDEDLIKNRGPEENDTLLDAVIVGAGWAGLAAGNSPLSISRTVHTLSYLLNDELTQHLPVLETPPFLSFICPQQIYWSSAASKIFESWKPKDTLVEEPILRLTSGLEKTFRLIWEPCGFMALPRISSTNWR